MYANPIWSVLLLIAVAALYWFIIRPKLKIKYAETYAHIDGWFARQWARVVAFRSYIATVVTAIMIAAPDIAVQLLPIDLSGFVGKWWAQAWTTGLTIFLAVNAAMKTKPGNEKP